MAEPRKGTRIIQRSRRSVREIAKIAGIAKIAIIFVSTLGVTVISAIFGNPDNFGNETGSLPGHLVLGVDYSLSLLGRAIMPTYEYLCLACQKTFSQTLTLAEAEKQKVVCPHCHSPKVEQRFSACYVVTSRKSAA
jgi:putative FmdB family regulatory protein